MAKIQLVRILSSEALPRIPPDLDPDVELYVRNLHDYLRRLFTKFTGQVMQEAMDIPPSGPWNTVLTQAA